MRHSNRLILEELLVMQSDLRQWDQIGSMISCVKNGGYWTKEYLEQYAKVNNLRISPVIEISRFEDGTEFLHDGHHRCVATWLGGRNYLNPDEFHMTDWLYDEYLEIAPHNNWYTPFDPRIHVRTADFGKFKVEARNKFAVDPKGAVDWLYENLKQFRNSRTIHYVPELADIVRKQLELI